MRPGSASLMPIAVLAVALGLHLGCSSNSGTAPGALASAGGDADAGHGGGAGGDAGSATLDGATVHAVVLTWTASTTPNVTYDLLRSAVSGGPYTQIQNGITAPSATDSSVSSGVTYYYVARSEDSAGQSVDSNEVKATIP
jgi:hypothetical protein